MRTPRQAGFGLLETLAGLLIFSLLAMLGTRAYRGSVQNHREASQVKALTDAVATTAERLGGLTQSALIGAGSPHLDWSEPAAVGTGRDLFRYRVVPRPSVGGAVDTTVVGLEVEAGAMQDGAFAATRSFATLIPPSGARTSLAQASSAAERAAEAVFHGSHVAAIQNLTARVAPENQDRLNSFNCYSPGECCGFMGKFLGNPSIAPQDGLEEKCHYRCALGGDVSMAQWKSSCGMDICASAPWKTSADCCRAIATGQCPPGSACARVCVDCVGENGSGCEESICDEGWFNDFFDCANGALCDGSPLPADVPNWGDVRNLCAIPACAGIRSQCHQTSWVCCKDYWGPLSRGETPNPKTEICATISDKQDCCEDSNRHGYFEISCTGDGRANGAKYNGTWYCADGLFETEIDGYCTMYRSCGTPTSYPDYRGGGPCIDWPRAPLEHAGVDPDPPPPQPEPPRQDPPRSSEPAPKPDSKPAILVDPSVEKRKASIREGLKWFNRGGRE